MPRTHYFLKFYLGVDLTNIDAALCIEWWNTLRIVHLIHMIDYALSPVSLFYAVNLWKKTPKFICRMFCPKVCTFNGVSQNMFQMQVIQSDQFLSYVFQIRNFHILHLINLLFMHQKVVRLYYLCKRNKSSSIEEFSTLEFQANFGIKDPYHWPMFVTFIFDISFLTTKHCLCQLWSQKFTHYNKRIYI